MRYAGPLAIDLKVCHSSARLLLHAVFWLVTSEPTFYMWSTPKEQHVALRNSYYSNHVLSQLQHRLVILTAEEKEGSYRGGYWTQAPSSVPGNTEFRLNQHLLQFLHTATGSYGS